MVQGNVAMTTKHVLLKVLVNVFTKDVKPTRIVFVGIVALLGIFVASVLSQGSVAKAGHISMVSATNLSRTSSYPGARPGITAKIKRTSV